MFDVPLKRGPALDLPPPVELPGDLHPIPDDITEYVGARRKGPHRRNDP